MKKDIQSSDLMRIMGLAPRKKKPEDAKYGRFNRRMMAATIDSLILIPLIPFIEPIFRLFYGPPPVNFAQLQQEARMKPTPEEASQFLWSTLYESGFFRYWAQNTTFQFGIMAFMAALCWMIWSSTPGKMVMRLKVVDVKTEGKPSILQCILRAMGYFISGMFLGLGFFWIIFDKKRQSWHDKLADTVVVTIPWAPFKHAKKAADVSKDEAKPASEAAAPSGSQAP
jgi:uncharacterized RDD family membrane protein YckC